MSMLYVVIGVFHFLKPKFFLYIMPFWVPCPKLINLMVGAIEIALGIAILFEPLRDIASWGIIALLIMIFPANVNHFLKSLRKRKGVVATAIRLPFQLLLIWWAYSYIGTNF